ncbi:MAG: tetratricopeptide repeat protein [Ktedonobacteraceae bacterium]
MSVKIFYCYANEDKKLRAELEKHLGILKRQELITDWSDRNIDAGKEWVKEIDINLNTANIILLLISPDFVHSDYCYSIEMQRALERHENGTARVIPIILRHGDYEGAPFNHLQALPSDAVPVTDRKWQKRDAAFFDVAKGIRKIVKELHYEQYLYDGNLYFHRQQYKEALTAFEEAIGLNPTNALAYISKGQALTHFASHIEGVFEKIDYCASALAAFEQVLCLDPNNACAYTGKGDALSQYSSGDEKEEALSAYDQAIRLDSKNDATYIGKGNALMYLERYDEALAAYEKAIEVSIFPNLDAYKGQGDALYHLKRYDDALAVYEKVIQEFPNSGDVYKDKGDALYHLECYDDAVASYYKAIALGFKSAPLYCEIGNLLCLLGYNQKALEAFEQAIRLDPDFYDAYKRKGNILELLAVEAFEQAKKVDPLGDLEDHPF